MKKIAGLKPRIQWKGCQVKIKKKPTLIQKVTNLREKQAVVFFIYLFDIMFIFIRYICFAYVQPSGFWRFIRKILLRSHRE